MNNQQQHMLNDAPIIFRSNDLHIIEEDSENEEEERPATEQDRSLEDALEAWKEINSLVRNIGRSLITREVSVLKRSAQEITQRCSDAAAQHELNRTPGNEQRHSPSSSSQSTEAAAGSPSKRRRVSGFTEDTNTSSNRSSNRSSPKSPTIVQASEQEALVRRMNRMRRMNAILVSINNSHGQLEEVIRDMMNDEEVSHA
jgi:hypothetical protein